MEIRFVSGLVTGFWVFLVSHFYTVNSGLPLFYVDVVHKSLSDFLCGVFACASVRVRG